MRIGIFPTMAGREAGGVETYERGLVTALARVDGENDYILYALSADTAAALDPHQPNFDARVVGPVNRVVSMSTTLPFAIAQDRLDILHATFVPPAIPPRNLIFSLHCMSQFLRPELYPRHIRWRINALTNLGVRMSKLTVCVSDTVRDQARDKFKIAPDRLCTVHNGIHDCFRPIADDAALRGRLKTRFGIDYPYVLFAGKLEARKNIVGLIRAFDVCRKEHRLPHKLVLAGRRNWASQGIDETIQELGLEQQVVFTGHLGLDELPGLYSGADVFVFPSFWEGFGIPVVEAMACGVPVVASDVSAIPEVAGDAALLIDPNRVEDIAEAISRVLQNPEFAKDLRQRGLARAEHFTWERVARQTLAAYQQASSL